MKLYAGIGARSTPTHIQDIMRLVANKLESLGWILRSGHASGADSAFESGIINQNNKEIFVATDATTSAIELSSQFHPVWNRCNPYTKMLHGRNSMILLGRNLNHPVKFVICYTDDGKDSGGTGLGIRIATHYNIPVFNLFDEASLQRIGYFLGIDLL